jgi:hypothetical protein
MAVIHIFANLYYTFIKKQPIIRAMVTGEISRQDYVDLQENSSHSNMRALVLLAFCIIFVFGMLYFFGRSTFS